MMYTPKQNQGTQLSEGLIPLSDSQATPNIFVRAAQYVAAKRHGPVVADFGAAILLMLATYALTEHAAEIFSLRFTWRLSRSSLFATAFLPSCAGAFFLYLVRDSARDLARERIERELKDRWLRTLRGFHSAQDGLHAVFVNALQRDGKVAIKRNPMGAIPPNDAAELIREDLRLALSNLLIMIDAIEPSAVSVSYASNIMRYFHRNEVTGEFLNRVHKALRFEPISAFKKARGVLFVEPSLSNSTTVEPNSPDEDLVELAMLIPPQTRTRDGERWTILPGAPHAFVQKEMWGTNAADLVNLCREQNWGPPGAAEKIEQYLGSDSGRLVCSLLSHPLMATEGREPQAILNIHSNKEDLLSDKDRRDQLYYLLRPGGQVILTLLAFLDEYESAA